MSLSLFKAAFDGTTAVLNAVDPLNKRGKARKKAEAERIRLRDEARDWDSGKYQRLVDQSQAAGFNPLTALRAGGVSPYDTTPAQASGLLSSDAWLQSALSVSDTIGAYGRSQMSDDEKERDQLELELLRNEVSNSATRQTGQSFPAMGSPRGSGPAVSAGGGYDRNDDLTPRDERVEPTLNFGGFFKVNAPFTSGDVFMPGNDGEPLGVGELAVALTFGAPQVGANYIDKGLAAVNTWVLGQQAAPKSGTYNRLADHFYDPAFN